MGIAKSVAARADMTLVGDRPLRPGDADARLAELPPSPRAAVILVGRAADSDVDRWLAERANLVVMHVDFIDDTVRMSVRNPHLDSLLNALRGLVERGEIEPQRRIAHVQVASGPPPEPVHVRVLPPVRPLLDAAIAWVHQVLRDAVDRVPVDNGDMPGATLSRATVLQALDGAPERARRDWPRTLQEADDTLTQALAAAEAVHEPLAAVSHACSLEPLEFRMLLLALAPEFDLRFQRAIGLLLDEVPRRAGTYSLYTALLGSPARIRAELGQHGALTEWLIFDSPAGRQPVADDPLRADPFLAQWLLGNRHALRADPGVRRALRLMPWPGADLLRRDEDIQRAVALVDTLADAEARQWIAVDGDDPAGWRALFELGALHRQVVPIRVDTARLSGADQIDVEETARRLGRMARLTGEPLVIDASRTDASDSDADLLRAFFAAVSRTGCQAAVIGSSDARIAGLLGAASFELLPGPPLPATARSEAVRTAAIEAGSFMSPPMVETVTGQYPLSLDGLEQAMCLARGRQPGSDGINPATFLDACREVAAAGVSHLADRLDPAFTLDQVVLPAEQHLQLAEIVANVRHAPRVLEEWRFGDQLPYGRGVTALFAGPSGTGKTMAAIGVTQALGIQILRLDLSRVVSKYIGDTEKNLDRVFTDAERSGAAILIDEADALFGKRSEVKDAHDRYANIEVAYLLQRMEAYQGLAILTTNQRQNLDAAFVRRLRFIIDFPRPDAEAREKIWRQCLPAASHTLDDRAFRQLARKVDLAGGHIRQITVRAAFIAAAAGTRIGLEHIAQATRAELAKLGMPPVDLDPKSGKQAA